MSFDCSAYATTVFAVATDATTTIVAIAVDITVVVVAALPLPLFVDCCFRAAAYATAVFIVAADATTTAATVIIITAVSPFSLPILFDEFNF
jgi:hypothetical protein